MRLLTTKVEEAAATGGASSGTPSELIDATDR
jgi:hypothetical protein